MGKIGIKIMKIIPQRLVIRDKNNSDLATKRFSRISWNE